MLGDDTKVRYVPVTGLTRFTALQSGEIDLLTMEVTWTLARDASQAIDFPVMYFFDGESFLVKASSNVKSALELNGATVCVIPGSATELNLSDYFRQHGMSFTPVVIENGKDAVTAYAAGRCDVLTNDRSILAVQRRTLLQNPADHVLLPEVASKEPYSPVVRHGDNQWGDIVRWSIWAMVEAEEQGVTAANAAEMRQSGNPTVKRLLGSAGDFGPMLGLSRDWSYEVIRLVGNYGESFERNLTPLGIDRGPNQLWTKGGLLYSAPFR